MIMTLLPFIAFSIAALWMAHRNTLRLREYEYLVCIYEYRERENQTGWSLRTVDKYNGLARVARKKRLLWLLASVAALLPCIGLVWVSMP